jgi:hypothetical protein
MPDLPAVPNHFVEQALSVVYDWRNNLECLISPVSSTISGKFRNSPNFHVSNEWAQWVSQHISDQYMDASVAVTHGIPSSQESGLHTDAPRNFCLFYLLKKGNDDQWTRWCRLKQGPLIPDREKKMFYELQKNTADQLISTAGDEFELLDQVCMPLNTWVYTDVRVLHQAGNHLGERIAIQISFVEDVFDLFDYNDEIIQL